MKNYEMEWHGAPRMPQTGPGMDNPPPDLACCFNCKHVAWAVGVGAGVLCRHAKNDRDGCLFQIPSRTYVCEFFETRKSPEQSPVEPDPDEPEGTHDWRDELIENIAAEGEKRVVRNTIRWLQTMQCTIL